MGDGTVADVVAHPAAVEVGGIGDFIGVFLCRLIMSPIATTQSTHQPLVTTLPSCMMGKFNCGPRRIGGFCVLHHPSDSLLSDSRPGRRSGGEPAGTQTVPPQGATSVSTIVHNDLVSPAGTSTRPEAHPSNSRSTSPETLHLPGGFHLRQRINAPGGIDMRQQASGTEAVQSPIGVLVPAL